MARIMTRIRAYYSCCYGWYHGIAMVATMVVAMVAAMVVAMISVIELLWLLL